MARGHWVEIKRVYEKPAKEDGMRILVDRLWPRGVSKEKAKIDLWLKDIAPSDGLRKWFGHQPTRWEEFRKRYLEELRNNKEALGELASLCRKNPVTLLYAAKDEAMNNAVVLKELLGHGHRKNI